ncbi:hypothetical protein SDC9_212746 [bioreactor metagenome]|uniref:Uncharacterized protein n=1 Tax=bioreactor metagenome TaxID=1076179 RepID=A0A645JNP2_9ZZZZ
MGGVNFHAFHKEELPVQGDGPVQLQRFPGGGIGRVEGNVEHKDGHRLRLRILPRLLAARLDGSRHRLGLEGRDAAG